MPHYRILIWTKRRKLPFKGIRIFETPIINAVQQQCEIKARGKFGKDFIDVEVQMLSKLSRAVKEFEKKVL